MILLLVFDYLRQKRLDVTHPPSFSLHKIQRETKVFAKMFGGTGEKSYLCTRSVE